MSLDRVKASDWAWVDPDSEVIVEPDPEGEGSLTRQANSACCSHHARLDAEQRSILPHGFREVTPRGLAMRSRQNEGGKKVRRV